jgi:hypothetical protein
LNLDVSATWLIGDSSSDVACALGAGLIPAIVSTGHGGNDGRHSTELALRFPTAADAIDFAIEEFPAVWQRSRAAVSDCTDGACIQAIGDSPEAAYNVARLLALAAMRLGKPFSMRLSTPLPETNSPGDADSSADNITAAVSTTAVTGHRIAVAP